MTRPPIRPLFQFLQNTPEANLLSVGPAGTLSMNISSFLIDF
jgi:hypothetical protein